MEILEAYDLAGTLRGTAAPAGCDHKTVAHWVRQRELAGAMVVAERRRPAVGEFAGKIDEVVERSHGRIRADVAHAKLVAHGDQGSEPTTRHWVAEAKRRWRREHRRRTRPWIPSPGCRPVWLRRRAGRGRARDGVVLGVAAWSRYRSWSRCGRRRSQEL
jgi:hypothetical protein